jgi:hypothetical protein
MARKDILIYKIARNYTSCLVWHGSRAFHNKLGSSKLTCDKGLTRKQRYEAIARFLVSLGEVVPSYRPTKQEEAAARS